MTSREEARLKRAAAALRYKPDRVDTLLVAEAPPKEHDRYFYFESVTDHDWLFRGVTAVLLGQTPGRSDKRPALARLVEMGVFLIDLILDPADGSSLVGCVPDLVRRCQALAPRRIILIKVSVYDASYASLKDAGLPVVDKRICFPSTGRQREFRSQFREAVALPSAGRSQPAIPAQPARRRRGS